MKTNLKNKEKKEGDEKVETTGNVAKVARPPVEKGKGGETLSRQIECVNVFHLKQLA